MDIKTLGIDLAKNIFQLHGVDAQGKVILKKRITRSELAEFIAKAPACLIGMESCGGANYWARKFQSFGHEVKIMNPQIQIQNVRNRLPDIVDDLSNELSEFSRGLFKELMEDLLVIDKRITDCDAKITTMFKADERCQKISAVEGIGVITATAIASAIGDPKGFKNGREFAAWLGLVPRQSSSGGKNILLGISKRGDRYLRTLLIHGARAVVCRASNKEDRRSRWINQIKNRRGMNKACVALANKNARIVWALLAKDKQYQKAT